jgi:hypothetical protein
MKADLLCSRQLALELREARLQTHEFAPVSVA